MNSLLMGRSLTSETIDKAGEEMKVFQYFKNYATNYSFTTSLSDIIHVYHQCLQTIVVLMLKKNGYKHYQNSLTH